LFKKYSFSWQLLRTFLISTLIPFMLVTTVLANTYSRKYNSDIRTLVDSTVDSMTSNIDTYLYELKQVTLLPYYNDEIYNYLEDLAGDVKEPGYRE
jgi:two-component system sensor histidine kinase YesM